MRKLMWFTIGFAAACAFCAYLLSGTFLLLLAVPFLVGSLIWYHREKEAGSGKAAVLVLVGLSVGICWYQIYTVWNFGNAAALDGEELNVVVEAAEFSRETDYGTAVEGKVEYDGAAYKVRLYLNHDVRVEPGDRISGTFRFERTAAQWDADVYYFAAEGISFLLYGTGAEEIKSPDERVWYYFPAYWRQAILDAIDRLFPKDTSAFAKALLLGDTSDLTYGDDTNLKLSGIRHVAAVSGLHISILFTFLMVLCRNHRFVASILMFPVMILFAAVSGFSPSVVRACLMQMVLHLAFLFGREADPPTNLSLAVLVILAVNPHSVMSVGLQLSATSVAGIMLMSEPIYERAMRWKIWGVLKNQSRKKRLVSWFCSSISVSISATLITTPLNALYFGTVSLIGVVSNLLILWCITAIFCGVVLIILLGIFWTVPARFLAGIVAWGIRYVLWMAKLMASLPLSALYTQSPYVVIWLILFYGMLVLYLKRKIPKLRYWVVTAVVVLAFAVGISWIEPHLGLFRVSVIDVGQGQSVLIQSEGKSYLVDCGGSGDKETADKVSAYLGSRGVFHLDGLILTHYDKDHVGAVPYLLQRVPVEQLFLPVAEDSDGWKEKILEQARGDLHWVNQDITIAFGDGQIRIFASENQETDNESSLCILFQKADYDILITGDRGTLGEAALILEEQLPQLEALVVGHHGSSGSTSAFLLEHLKPQTAVISVGADNHYGHPSQTVLDRLTEFGCEIRRTDLEGTIVLTG